MNPSILISTDPKEAGHYFTPAQAERFEHIYGKGQLKSYSIRLFSEADITALQKRVRVLELALGAMLHDFDDGVNGGCEHRLRSLDFARQVCKAVKFKKRHAKELGVKLSTTEIPTT